MQKRMINIPDIVSVDDVSILVGGCNNSRHVHATARSVTYHRADRSRPNNSFSVIKAKAK